MGLRAGALLLCCASAMAQPTVAVTDAALALVNAKPSLRFTAYGEADLAPLKIFRDERRTYIQLRSEPAQRVDALEVTSIGYRRLPSTYERPYLVVGGFAPSLAISYPGQPLVFVEFGPEGVRQPADDRELQLRLRERAMALLDQQTRLEEAEREVLGRARTERLAAQAHEQEALAISARAEQLRQASDRQAAATRQAQEAKAAELSRRGEQLAVLARRAFSVYRNDRRLRGVLTRWTSNDGLQLVWSAPDDAVFNPAVAADGGVEAHDLKDAIGKLLEAFRSKQLDLQAVFYSDGVVEISPRGKAP